MLGKYLVTVLVLATVAAFGKSGCAQDKILMSYGGFNETAGPLWVGMEKVSSKNTAWTSARFKSATARSVYPH